MDHHLYGLSSDKVIRLAYQSLSKKAQDCIDRRNQISALHRDVDIDTYLWLISNPLNK